MISKIKNYIIVFLTGIITTLLIIARLKKETNNNTDDLDSNINDIQNSIGQSNDLTDIEIVDYWNKNKR
jgi:hypothetical protein